MVSLQPERAGGVVPIAARARSLWARFYPVQDLLPVVIDRQSLFYKQDVERFPLPGRLAGNDRGCDPPVEGAAARVAGLLAITVGDLYFVAIPHVHSGVASGNNLEFHVQLKTVEVPVSLNVGSLGRGRVNAILRFPQVGPVGLAQMPSGEILSVEEINPAGTFIRRLRNKGKRKEDQERQDQPAWNASQAHSSPRIQHRPVRFANSTCSETCFVLMLT